jgi:Rha family phage regulatory protein
MQLVQLHNNQPTTTSLLVAEYFGKQHKHVIRDIKNIYDQDSETNFGLTNYTDSQGRKQPMYYIDRDGFTLLAMGFTGKKALQFKKDYIRAFNEMEKTLKEPKLILKTPEQLTTKDILKLATTEIERLEAKVQKLTHSTKTYTTTEIAKEMGLTSANALNQYLSSKGIQYKINNTWVLYSQYQNKNYTSIKQMELENGKIIYDRRWTGLGRDFIINI